MREPKETEYHVLPGFRGGWVAKRRYAIRASRRFLTKAQAIRYATPRCSVLVIHNRDGTVSSIRHVGADA